MDEHITYIGLDVHKETISVALAVGDRRGEVREHGRISNTRLLSKLSQPGAVLRFCYEVGPCGYGIQRQLDNRFTAVFEQQGGQTGAVGRI